MSMPDSFFRILSMPEEDEFEQWAQDWFSSHPGDDPDPMWHPVVRSEIKRLQHEAAIREDCDSISTGELEAAEDILKSLRRAR